MTEAMKHCLDLDPDRPEFDLFAEEMSLGELVHADGCCASTISTATTVSCPSSVSSVSCYSSECCS